MFTAEFGVNLVPVAGPVAVVASFKVVDNWGDPDSSETHVFDVVEVLGDSFEGASAVVAQVVAVGVVSVASAETVGEDLVNGAAFPGFFISRFY